MITYCTRGWCNFCKSEALLEVTDDGIMTCTNCGITVNVCKKCHGSGWWQHTERDEGGSLIFHVSMPCPDCTNKNKEGVEE